MAKKPKRITDAVEREPRQDVTWRNAGLLTAFALLLVVSIFTVMVPELTDDGADEEADAAGASAAAPPTTDAPPVPPASAP